MTSSLLAGLGVGLVGALLLATGMDLQSRAVQAADGRSREWLRDHRWWAGVALLGSAVGTNLVALALAPVSAVQSVNIIALAVSTLLTSRSRPGVLTRETLLAVAASVTGVLGFVAVLSAHPADSAVHDLEAQRAAVMTILATLTVLAGLAWLIGRHPGSSESSTTDRARRGTTRPRGTGPSTARALLGDAAAATVFASVTTVVKVHVDLVLGRGLPAVLADPVTLLAAGLLLPAGALASLLLQRAHRDLAAPTVVAGTTLTDTLTAAVIGILVLGESAPTPFASLLLLAFAAIAVLGVLGLRRGLPAAGPGLEETAPVRASRPVLTGRHRSGEGTGADQDPALVGLRPGSR